jgi:hypothetical protein
VMQAGADCNALLVFPHEPGAEVLDGQLVFFAGFIVKTRKF